MLARSVAGTRRPRASRANCPATASDLRGAGEQAPCSMRISVAADWVSTSFDPDVLGEPARLTCQREVFKFAAEQKRLDTRNDHFCPALRACRRRWFWWRFPASHMITFHPELFGASSVDRGGVVGRGPRSGDASRWSLLQSYSPSVCEPPAIRLSRAKQPSD